MSVEEIVSSYELGEMPSWYAYEELVRLGFFSSEQDEDTQCESNKIKESHQ